MERIVFLSGTPNGVVLEGQSHPEGGRDKPPAREPSDAWIFMGIGIGAVVGGGVGFLAALKWDHAWLAVGWLSGGFIGTMVGAWLKDQRRRRSS